MDNLILLVGIVSFLAGLFFLYDRILYLRKGIATPATFVRMEVSKDSEGDDMYTPFFEYTAHNNERYEYEYPISGSINEWQTGDEIKLVYHPTRPWNAVDLTYMSAFGTSAIFIGFGIVFILLKCGYSWALHFIERL